MRIILVRLIVRTRRTVESVFFSESVTYLHGPVGTGKSTVARMIDFCLGGDLERTPAIQQEFVAAELEVVVGEHRCVIERSSDDTQSVRVTWAGPGDDLGSISAPLDAAPDPVLDAEVFNLSDLVFHLAGVEPIKVRRRTRDADSPLVRLSIRDIWRFCYLDQAHLDSSFFRFEDPFRGRKSQDAMRFFTGLHSERLSQLESELATTLDEQRSKRQAVEQIRSFMSRFDLGSELEIRAQLDEANHALGELQRRRDELERTRSADTHPSDSLRRTLRSLGSEVDDIRRAVIESESTIAEQIALRAELITAKTKAERADQAGRVLEGVEYKRCPQCGTDVSAREVAPELCGLCGSVRDDLQAAPSLELEALRRDFNERIDRIAESIGRRERQLNRMKRQLAQAEERKALLDQQLQEELERYDSSFVESIRLVERESATLSERVRSLERLQHMPEAIDDLEEEAGALQGRIDRLRSQLEEERARLQGADEKIRAVAEEFKDVMLRVGFPGVSETDDVTLDPRNWRPTVSHGAQEWSFWDVGSGGKKTLFNVCYALALHAVALRHEMPVPSLLVLDSPTKNISEDEDTELVQSLYTEIYQLARDREGQGLQFLLIDSDFFPPGIDLPNFVDRRMAGTDEAPSLIPYYVGP
ncbi:MAG: DUF3732 domain-containing protein [Acidobacteria bacterium]|nr:DUF3732 domain-containing protein [Acidobacteriota bacterium]